MISYVFLLYLIGLFFVFCSACGVKCLCVLDNGSCEPLIESQELSAGIRAR